MPKYVRVRIISFNITTNHPIDRHSIALFTKVFQLISILSMPYHKI